MPTWEVRESVTALPDGPGQPQREEVVRLVTIPHRDLADLPRPDEAVWAFVAQEELDMSQRLLLQDVRHEVRTVQAFPWDDTVVRIVGWRALGPTTPQRRLVGDKGEHPATTHLRKLMEPEAEPEPERRARWWAREVRVNALAAWLTSAGALMLAASHVARYL